MSLEGLMRTLVSTRICGHMRAALATF